jgi:alpha/beta superfamily hydrolase
MTPRTVVQRVAGPAGPIECAIDAPQGEPRGIALACHPHPQFGGTMDNKVVQTLARACVQCGWKSVRFNFRGIGASAGAWDEGRGELEDARAVLAAFRAAAPAGQPYLVGGFSFGGWIAAELVASLAEGDRPERVILVAPSTQQHRLPPLAPDTIVVHGEADDVVPLASTLDWARPLGLPVIVFPGVGHFFHGKIPVLKNVLARQLQDVRPA